VNLPFSFLKLLLVSVANFGFLFVSDVSVTVSVTVNEKAYVRKLMDMTFLRGVTSRFAHLEKTNLVFQVRTFAVLVNLCHP